MEYRSTAITSRAVEKEQKAEKEDPRPYSVYISNLSRRVREKDLRNLFSKYELQGVRVPHFRETGEARGFAFVDFGSEEEGMRAMREFSGREIYGRQISIEKAHTENDELLFAKYKRKRDLKMDRALEKRNATVSWDPDEDLMPVKYQENRRLKREDESCVERKKFSSNVPYQPLRMPPHPPQHMHPSPVLFNDPYSIYPPHPFTPYPMNTPSIPCSPSVPYSSAAYHPGYFRDYHSFYQPPFH